MADIHRFPTVPLRDPALQPVYPGESGRAGEPHIDCTLVKGERRRRYWIRLAGRKTQAFWACQVWFGDTQHRGENTTDLIRAQRRWWEYRREINELLNDGWTISA